MYEGEYGKEKQLQKILSAPVEEALPKWTLAESPLW